MTTVERVICWEWVGGWMVRWIGWSGTYHDDGREVRQVAKDGVEACVGGGSAFPESHAEHEEKPREANEEFPPIAPSEVHDDVLQGLVGVGLGWELEPEKMLELADDLWKGGGWVDGVVGGWVGGLGRTVMTIPAELQATMTG